jgi:hypothetical protein
LPKFRAACLYHLGEVPLSPVHHIARPIDAGGERSRIQKRRLGHAAAKANFKYTVVRLKLELLDSKRIHSRVVPVHQMSDGDANKAAGARKLVRDETGCHSSKPEAVSGNARLIAPILVAEFPFEIFFFPPYHTEVQNQHAEALVEAAVARLEADGVEALSLRELARDTGVNHGAVYRRFPDKLSLLARIAEEGWHLMERRVKQQSAGKPAGEQTLVAAGVGFFLFVRFDGWSSHQCERCIPRPGSRDD